MRPACVSVLVVRFVATDDATGVVEQLKGLGPAPSEYELHDASRPSLLKSGMYMAISPSGAPVHEYPQFKSDDEKDLKQCGCKHCFSHNSRKSGLTGGLELFMVSSL
jgi:hypothetical protein